MLNPARLHLLMSPEAVADLAGQLNAQDRIVLLDRGVELLLHGETVKDFLAVTHAVYCSGSDRAARGLPLAAGTVEIDDAQLIKLVEECRQVLSWG